MKRLLLWLLPIVDIFTLKNCLKAYRKIGVDVPLRHAELGMVERLLGYLPAGFVIGHFSGFLLSLLLILILFSVVGPVEFFLMKRGCPPWKFFKEKRTSTVAKIFLLEGYNAIGYYLLGAAIASFFYG